MSKIREVIAMKQSRGDPTPKSSGWFFQYGRWDIRIHCPWCATREAYMISLKDLDTDWYCLNPGMCFNCKNTGIFKFEEMTWEKIARIDIYEEQIINMGWVEGQPRNIPYSKDGRDIKPKPALKFKDHYFQTLSFFEDGTPVGIICDKLLDEVYSDKTLSELRKAKDLATMRIPQLWTDLPELIKE